MTREVERQGPPPTPIRVATLTPVAESALPGVSQLQPAPPRPLTKNVTWQVERRPAAMIAWGILGVLLLVLSLASSGGIGAIAGLVFATYSAWRFFIAWRGLEALEPPAAEVV
jgi:hypothetical protein